MAMAVVRQRRSRMRLWALAAAPLVAFAAIACCLGQARQAATQPESTWRRTRDGWERLLPELQRRPFETPFHPFFFVTIQSLVVAMALVAHEPAGRQRLSAPAPHFGRRKKLGGAVVKAMDDGVS